MQGLVAPGPANTPPSPLARPCQMGWGGAHAVGVLPFKSPQERHQQPPPCPWEPCPRPLHCSARLVVLAPRLSEVRGLIRSVSSWAREPPACPMEGRCLEGSLVASAQLWLKQENVQATGPGWGLLRREGPVPWCLAPQEAILACGDWLTSPSDSKEWTKLQRETPALALTPSGEQGATQSPSPLCAWLRRRWAPEGRAPS